MNWRHTCFLLTLCLSGLAHAATWKIALLELADDPRLERARLERAYLGHPGGSAADGISMALKDSTVELRSAQQDILLEHITVDGPTTIPQAVRKAEKDGAKLLLVNLPADGLLAAADATSLPVINISASDDRLREQDCRSHLFHVMPSDRMRADAMAQALVNRKWAQVLMLVGPEPRDAERAEAAQSAIKRHGLKLVARKGFKLSSDPRDREQANTLLLTGSNPYDVLWVVDSDGEFARTLPYNTILPRPVVGDAGWVTLAWHAQFERYGAPQVARRFAKINKRPMTDHDWAGWVAGKAAVAVATASKGSAPLQTLRDAQLDGSKGVNMQFRPWDRQLRQPLMLTDGQGVLTTLPLEGVLHPHNILDTLGADAPQKLCQPRR